MPIHTFGDSHSSFGWRDIKEVQTHHLGPKLCFSVGRDGIDIKGGFNVKNGDTVIFCVGEIDCRCHIYKYVTETNDYKGIIDGIVDRYFIRIKEATDAFDALKIAIYNVVPPVQKGTVDENPDYPYLGTDAERKSYVLYFNEKLKEKCREYKYVFFDVYDKYTDENGFLNKSLSDGNVHIRDGRFIYEFIMCNGFV
jgi:hypothetical protein